MHCLRWSREDGYSFRAFLVLVGLSTCRWWSVHAMSDQICCANLGNCNSGGLPVPAALNVHFGRADTIASLGLAGSLQLYLQYASARLVEGLVMLCVSAATKPHILIVQHLINVRKHVAVHRKGLVAVVSELLQDCQQTCWQHDNTLRPIGRQLAWLGYLVAVVGS